MLKTILFFLFLLCGSSLVYAQSSETFLLKGNVRNLKENAFEIQISGYLMHGSDFIPIDSKGNFSKILPTDGLQDVRLVLSPKELLQFFVVPNDTIVLNWDQDDSKNSLKISSPSKERNSELTLMADFYKQRFGPFIDMYQRISAPELPEAPKYQIINDAYLADLALMKNRPLTKYTTKIINDIYFKHIDILDRLKLLNKYDLLPDQAQKEVLSSQGILPEQLNYRILDESSFHESYIYRSFLYTQMKSTRPFKEMVKSGAISYEQTRNIKNIYALGQAFLNNPLIKDWYITKVLYEGLYNNDLVNVRPLYQQYLKECKTPDYVTFLTEYYDNTEKLNAGQAPLFTLKDLEGKSVSLADFKGKIVFIDFWGVYCPPCRSEILTYAREVHQKYKDKEVVFINICIDEKGAKLKKAVQQLKLTGINLVAEGHRIDKVVKAYNVNGIPHHVVIDGTGKLISYKKLRLSNLAGNNLNIIDQLLAK